MRPLIIAHRGSSAVAPENSLAAFQRALDDGAEGIEFDVRLTSDHIPVVFHDETLDRISGQKRRVSEMAYSELANIDVGAWFNASFPSLADTAYSGEAIPTLSQTLELLKDYQGRIYIELKCDGPDPKPLVRSVTETLGTSFLLNQIIVKSFRLSAIRTAREFLPGLRTAALFEPTIMTVVGKKRFIIHHAAEFEADELSIHYSLATRRFLRRATERSIPVTVWTVNHPLWVKNRKEMGLFAVITNNPKLMITTLDLNS